MNEAIAEAMRAHGIPLDVYPALASAHNLGELVTALLPALGRDHAKHVVALKALAAAGLPGKHGIGTPMGPLRDRDAETGGWSAGQWVDVLIPRGVEAKLRR